MNEASSTARPEAVAGGPCDQSGPLFADTGLKLGIFGLNVSSAGAISQSPDRHEISWEQNVELVRSAEAAGFEAAIPYARWRGFEGASNPWGNSFETYCWAAGLAAHTSRIAIFATSHCLTVSPVMAAKQLATIDHISGGRVGLNVVAGWFERELAMFGAQQLVHDDRYVYSEEWLDILLRLWGDESSKDYSGRFLSLVDGYQQPKPLQSPRPPIMNAAFSPRGHQLAVRYADIAFVSAATPQAAREKSQELRSLAARENRTIQVWMSASVILGESDTDADRIRDEYETRHRDDEAIRNCLDWTMGGAQLPPERRRHMERTLASTAGSHSLTGGPQSVARQMTELHDAGIDGLCLTWMNYEQGLRDFTTEVLPRLEKDGVRRLARTVTGPAAQ